MSVAHVLLVAGSANFSTRDVWDGYRVALEAAGVRVIPYATFSFLRVLSADAVCNDILGTALDEQNRIDHVIFVDGLYFRGKRARVPSSIRRAGVPTVLIATDDPYEPIPNSESLYTYRFTNERACSGQGIEYLPTAALPPPPLTPPERPVYDVSFLGTVFPERMPLLLQIAQFCEQQRLRFLVAGKILDGAEPFAKYTFTEVRQRTIDGPEKWEIYSQSRLTINLFRDAEPPADSANPRVYEVTALGHAALISGPPRREVREIYGDSVYHFQDAASATHVIRQALAEPAERSRRVAAAQAITSSQHLYAHRAARLLDHLRQSSAVPDSDQAIESQLTWIIGCGRTGSTWLAEMLGDLPQLRRWHEPYFGRFFRHLQERPDDLQRPSSFFASRHQRIWLGGIRRMFFEMVRDRYPRLGGDALVIKEVNTPELNGWLRIVFPSARLLMLVRDPYDVLDSYLDLQKPGSWNERFGGDGPVLGEANVRRTAEHIRSALALSLDAYEAFEPAQRRWVTYEQLLQNPAAQLQSCAQWMGHPVDAATAGAVADRHRFANYKQTGTLQFRRRGVAAGWQTSPNFADAVGELAQQVLGPLRARLGYRDDQATSPRSSALP